MTNAELLQRFYESFARGDAEGMAACYADDVVFTDPAFGTLQGEAAKNMWRMLIDRSKGNLNITFAGITADENKGSANWTADYVFTQTGRKVINHVSAAFAFRDGKIVRHTDRFNLWKWAGQALGWKGYLLGWSPFMKQKIQRQTNGLLKAYTKRRA